MHKRLVPALAIAALLADPLFAQAQDIALYELPDPQHPLLITTEGGLVFMHADGKPGRAYAWKALKGKDGLFVTNMDRTGGPEVVGAGKPTFMIHTSADPAWFLDKGCAAVTVADIVGDNKLDLACIQGKEVKVYTHDLQFAWSATLNRALDSCLAGDLNGDLKADLECKLKGSKNIAKLDATGKIIDPEAKQGQLSTDSPATFEPAAQAGVRMEGGSASIDLDGDGNPDNVQHDGGKLLLSTAGPVVAVDLKDAPQVLYVRDFGADKIMDLVTVTKKEILLISTDGKKIERFPLAAARYKRKPLAELRTIYANGFADNNAAQEAIRAVQAPLSACYASQAKQGSFTGSGQLILTLRATDAKVTSVEKVHSEIADGKVVTCAINALKKVKPPASATEGAEATVNVTMTFTFRDQP
jgi:hypothetical protein